ncbi:GNAT family N-acetyltransferase [Enterococcus caccae]|uniref:N-acetyltransferase domain-containing protein n=1 Tax=Enterococcus caccae ATCC BAA-1240 TaxID=1158612 RepID=R3W9K0_9ENTE|nr:GNAT family N-acetyltransferase [Enterococcus caccae]EOL44556.1 hypothetical protein UC7_02099 [Enterococcus caccae ATCC BAA-1240]EOT58699.1 hypothetical protein I580_02871 [Enterococcus caccae ATCC BAA-1240]
MRIIKYGSQDTDFYEQTLHLRNKVLRQPLGKSIFEEDLTIEKENDFYGWEKERQIIATLSIYTKENKVAQLTAFAVEPTYQNKGYGNRLLEFLLDDLGKKGYERVDVSARSSAKTFYEKSGFMVLGNPVVNVALGTEDYLMTRVINFSVK